MCVCVGGGGGVVSRDVDGSRGVGLGGGACVGFHLTFHHPWCVQTMSGGAGGGGGGGG